MKLVIIASELAIVIEVTILSCDGLEVVTNEFAIIIEGTRLSCDGPVIIAYPIVPSDPVSIQFDPSVFPAIPHYSKLLVEN